MKNSDVLRYSIECVVKHARQRILTQHDMLPQHLVCKYQLNCEYYNFSKELSSLMMI